jgi:hypothetical protein
LTHYPHRADEEYFDVFMDTLSDLVNEACPSSNRPDFTNLSDDSEWSDDWADVHEQLAASTAGLSIASGNIFSETT